MMQKIITLGFDVYCFLIIVIITLVGCKKDFEIIEITRITQLEKVIDSEFKRMQLSGLAVASANEQGIAYIEAFGFANMESRIPFTIQTRIQVASISKLVVSIAVMQMVESGLLDLNTDINQYLSFKVRNPSYLNEAITLKMLLTHSSSIVDAAFIFSNFSIFSNHDFPEPLGLFLKNYLTSDGAYFTRYNYASARPNDSWQYSNIATSLAAFIVEEISGLDFNEYCKANIFFPLEMHHTSWRYSETPLDLMAIPYVNQSRKTPKFPFKTYPDYPAGHLITSVEDLSKFLLMLIIMGKLGGEDPLISRASLDMIQLEHRNDLKLPSPPRSVYNLGPELNAQGLLFLKGKLGKYNLWGHTGDDAGISTELYFDAEKRVGYIILNNRTWAHSPVISKALLDYGYNN